MAMDGDRNFNDGKDLPKQNWRTRIDPRHSQSNVPVLFRLKNLQRVATDDFSDATPASVPEPIGRASARGVERSRGSSPTSNSPSHDAALSSTSAASNTKPAQSAKPDPVTTPGKHGVSNGFILLVVAVIVAFAVGRNMNRSVQMAKATTDPSRAASSSTASTTSPQAAMPIPDAVAAETKSPEPLVIPELPKLDADTPSKADASNTTTETTVVGAPSQEPGLTLLDPNKPTEESADEADAADDKLPLPTTLTTIENPNIPKNSTSTSQAEKTTSETTFDRPSPPAVAAKPDAQAGPSILATETPERDVDSLMRIRTNFLAQNSPNVQSQMDALARSRQSNPNPGNVAAQPIGYGQPMPSSPTYTSSMPNTGAMSNAYGVPPSSYPLPQSNTLSTGPTHAPAHAPAPTADAQFVQPMNQPYRPIYSDPVNMPMPASSDNFALPPSQGSVPYVPIGNTFNPNGL